MIIKKIAVGNKTEGFIESSLIDGCNIISSDDNNKGKTIVALLPDSGDRYYSTSLFEN